MSFFKTVFSVCSGTKVFLNLVTVPPWKAILHYCMLAVICAFLIAIFNISYYSGKASETSLLLTKVFGQVDISKNGILPESDQETPRTVELSEDLRLSYFPEKALPNADIFEAKDNNEESIDRGIAWTPGIVFAWMKVKDGKIFVIPFIAQKDKRDVEILDQQETRNWLIQANKPPFSKFNLPFHKISFQNFAGHAVLAATVLTFLGYLAHIIFSAFLFSGVFSIIYSLIGDENIPGLTIKKLFSVALYAGIPGTLIGTCFPAFNLPYLSYQTVYLACLLIYLISVLNALKRASAPPEKEDTDDDEMF